MANTKGKKRSTTGKKKTSKNVSNSSLKKSNKKKTTTKSKNKKNTIVEEVVKNVEETPIEEYMASIKENDTSSDVSLDDVKLESSNHNDEVIIDEDDSSLREKDEEISTEVDTSYVGKHQIDDDFLDRGYSHEEEEIKEKVEDEDNSSKRVSYDTIAIKDISSNINDSNDKEEKNENSNDDDIFKTNNYERTIITHELTFVDGKNFSRKINKKELEDTNLSQYRLKRLEKEMRSLYDKVNDVVDEISYTDEINDINKKIEKVKDSSKLRPLPTSYKSSKVVVAFIIFLAIIFLILFGVFIWLIIYVCTY